jgi:hypothetical protein
MRLWVTEHHFDNRSLPGDQTFSLSSRQFGWLAAAAAAAVVIASHSPAAKLSIPQEHSQTRPSRLQHAGTSVARGIESVAASRFLPASSR